MFIERSTPMLIALLAIFKVGGTYVPLEPDYPASRVEFMMQDFKAHVLLTVDATYSSFLKSTTNPEQWSIWFGDRVVYLDKPIPEVASKQLQPTGANAEGIYL